MELIDRQAFLKNKVWNCGGNPSDPYYNGYSDALDRVQEVLEEAPTVEAVPVVHGRWIVERHSEHTNCYCSICHMNFYYRNKGQLQIDKLSYCPNCGAKMDGGAERG